jgi:chemotaxis signal transduction protein
MPMMLRFRAGPGDYFVDLVHALEVRPRSALQPLPAMADGIAGVLERDAVAVTVVSALGEGDRHVLVLRAGDRTIGLLVDEVVGVQEVAASTIGPPPAGQRPALVQATVHEDGHLSYVLAVDELAARTHPVHEENTP